MRFLCVRCVVVKKNIGTHRGFFIYDVSLVEGLKQHWQDVGSEVLIRLASTVYLHKT